MARKKLILIVEDNEDFQALFGLVAKEAGFEVDAVYNGQEALQRLEREPIPDLVVLDSHLPGAYGDEVLQAVRTRENWSLLPVYIMTADLRAAQRYKAFSPDVPHADGVIEKGPDLIGSLRELFEKYREHDTN